MTLEQALDRLDSFPETAWLYLRQTTAWTGSMESAVLQSEEVAPEEEDDPQAGVPDFAKLHGFKQVLPVTVVQDILSNLTHSKPNPGLLEKIAALKFYYDNDAYLPVEP